MRLASLLLLVALPMGCSSASSAPTSTASGDDDASPGNTPTDGSAGDGQTSGGDASSPDAGDTGAGGPSEQTCAACTATDCLAALEACGSSQACLGALQEFNTCYAADSTAGATCGATLAETGSEASSLWSCLSSKCQSSCG
jgi:hypothetical protein